MTQMNLRDRNRLADVENRLMVAEEGGVGGRSGSLGSAGAN